MIQAAAIKYFDDTNYFEAKIFPEEAEDSTTNQTGAVRQLAETVLSYLMKT